MKTFLSAILLLTIGLTLAKGSVRKFKEYQLVPDIIDQAPDSLARIRFDRYLTVQTAKELTPTQVKNKPVVTWKTECGSYFTLIMTDPDVPSRSQPTDGEFIHWLVGNIPGTNVAQGDNIAPFISSAPANGTGLHRYTFLIYEQPEELVFTEDRLTDTSVTERYNFSTPAFTAKYKLGEPIAGNFYRAKFDEYVLEVYKKLGVEA